MKAEVSVIDTDAIPLDLPRQERQPIAMLYTATVVTLPDGREVVMPHYNEPVWQWFGKASPTLAHVPQGQAGLRAASSSGSVADVGERGRPRRY